jgi:hypothetical protein
LLQQPLNEMAAREASSASHECFHKER